MGGDVDVIFRILDLTGVLGNALIGGAIARQEKLDPVGFATLAILSGLGGGMIRDTLLQVGPPVALVDYSYLFVALLGAAFSYLFVVRRRFWGAWVWPVVDAVALGCWATTGAQKTLAAGLGWPAAIMLGVITAVGGGALRDVVLRRVPVVLGGNTLYASAAGLGAVGFIVVNAIQPTPLAQLTGIVLGAGLCLLARWRKWILPGADAWNAAASRRVKSIVRRPRRGRGEGAPAE